MQPVPPALRALLSRQCGVLSVREALAHLTPAQVRWRIDSGAWQQPARVVMVAHSGPILWEQQLWIGLKRAGSRAVLTGVTAAVLDGLRGHSCSEIHVLLPAAHTVRGRHSLVVHRSTSLDPADVHPIRLPPRTRLSRSVADAAAWAQTSDDARAILAAAVQQRLVLAGQLRTVVERLGCILRRQLLLSTLDDVAIGAHSVLEMRFLRLCRRARLPAPSLHVRRGTGSSNRWLDAAWEEYGVVVEIDGSWHMEASSWWSDLRRQNRIVADGEVVLRYPA